MQRTLRALPLTILALAAWLPPPVLAQDTNTARGTVTAIAARSVNVKAGDRDMTFAVDSDTVVTAEGAGTASRRAAAAGSSGPTLADFVKVGDAVEVSYRDMGGSLRATNVRRVTSPGPGGGSAMESKAESSEGTVDSVSGSSITVMGSTGGGGTFTQSFALDGSTKIVGEGAGTAAAARGGKFVATDYIAKGDRVRVTYRSTGATLVASEIRVTFKAKK